MPTYAKILKEIFSNERKIENSENIILNVVCSTLIQKEFPTKLEDPRSFTIPCEIGTLKFDRA